MSASPLIPAERIIIVMPNWLGDAVMATPFLRALRALYPHAHIAALARPLVAPVLAGLPFVNEITELQSADLKAWMKLNRFDLAILLPNSFRSAWLVLRQTRHRLGYARDGRSLLLNHRVPPVNRSEARHAADRRKKLEIQQIAKELDKPARGLSIGSPFQPIATIDYYCKLAEYLGAPPDSDKHMRLAITPEEESQADQVLASAGVASDENLAIIVPGANFGASKCWLPERFAAVADKLIEGRGAKVVIASAPAEMPIVDSIVASSQHRDRLLALAKLNNGQGVGLGPLKKIVRRSKLMLCNDTGPRHFAAAFGVPTVTLFGPTDPVWAETYSKNERIVRIDVPCGPCQLKQCPIDHRCMTGLTVEMVMNAIDELWPRTAVSSTQDSTLRTQDS